MEFGFVQNDPSARATAAAVKHSPEVQEVLIRGFAAGVTARQAYKNRAMRAMGLQAKAGLNHQRSWPAVDLVISDAVMPKMGGRELFDAVSRERPNLPFMFCSGHALGTISPGILEGYCRSLLGTGPARQGEAAARSRPAHRLTPFVDELPATEGDYWVPHSSAGFRAKAAHFVPILRTADAWLG